MGPLVELGVDSDTREDGLIKDELDVDHTS